MPGAISSTFARRSLTPFSGETSFTDAHSIVLAGAVFAAATAAARKQITQCTPEALLADAYAIEALGHVAFLAVHTRSLIASIAGEGRLARALAGKTALAIARAIERALSGFTLGTCPAGAALAHRAIVVALSVPAAFAVRDAAVGALEARAAVALPRAFAARHPAHTVGEGAPIGAQAIRTACALPATTA